MELNYTDQGHGKAILCIHGFCESLELWTNLSQELSKTARVICVDLPGFGQSRFDTNKIESIEDFATILHDFMQNLKIENYHLMGHSFGGYVALAMAELYPKNVLSLVLFHSTAYPDNAEKKLNREKTIAFIQKNGLDKFMDSFVTPLFAETNRQKNKDAIQNLISIGKQADQDAVLKTIATMRNRKDRRHVLATSSVPVLMIIGEEDIAIHLTDSLEQTELNPKIQNIVLSHCGHMGMIEKPITCQARLQEFYLS